MSAGTVVDSDSHIIEPANMWRDYIDPAYRSRAMGINVDDKGLEYLDIDGKMSSGYSGGALGRIAAVEKDRDWIEGHSLLPYAEAATLAPGAAYPAERIKHLAEEGVDKTFLFPSLGLGWEAGGVEDAEISDAYCRAYNRWLVDFCKDHTDQLFPRGPRLRQRGRVWCRRASTRRQGRYEGCFYLPCPRQRHPLRRLLLRPLLGCRPGPRHAHYAPRHLQPQLRWQAPLPRTTPASDLISSSSPWSSATPSSPSPT